MFNKSFITENQQVFFQILKEKNVQLFIKREDAIHPFVSGNKFRKLKYNIRKAKKENHHQLLTFGGAFSNHIAATAVAGNLSGLKTIGVIRGNELRNNLDEVLENNKTLKTAVDYGMELFFVSREEYRNKQSEAFLNQLKNKFGNFYLVPEGGTNSLAIKGCEEILMPYDNKFDYICVAVGTGGTISGLIQSTLPNQKILGFPALKGDFLKTEINRLLVNDYSNWSLKLDYHFGGYAKYTPELIRFMNTFKKETNIILDPIYTAKMLYGIIDMVTKNYFKRESKILAIHTGGLQGIDGINKKLNKKNLELIQQ